MHKGIRRITSASLATLVAAGLLSVAPAYAETDAIRQAEAELAKIQEESSKIDSDFANAQAAYEEAKAKLDRADADIATQSKKVAALKTSLAQLALVRYQSNGVNITAQLLASADESAFLDSLARLDSVTRRANNSIQDVQVEEAKLTRLREDAKNYTASMKAQKDKQAELVKQYDEKEKRAQGVLDRLKDEERAQLVAAREAQAREAAQAAQAATQTAPASRPSTQRATNAAKAPAEAPAPSSNTSAAGSSRAQAAVNWAKTQVGRPYIFGSTGPSGYDCSGLTTAAYSRQGIALPRTSQTQFRVGTPVSKSDLRPGDLLFFYGGITHVGLYAGNGVMVHSSPSGRGVHYSKLATYPAYKGARRVA